jgi:phenylalanyl-tRNA synthetase alpha chain
LKQRRRAFAATDDPDALEQIKATYLGKSGRITELLKGLGQTCPDQRKTAGAAINRAKDAVEAALNARREAIRQLTLNARLAEEALDVTLPGRGQSAGGLHPVTRTLERIETLFRSIGFAVADGPEIEADFQNFTALNTPADHPCPFDARYLLSAGRVGRNVAEGSCCARIPARSRSATCRRTSPATPARRRCPRSG